MIGMPAMNSEQIAALLKDVGIKQLIEALSILDPDMVKVMEVINMLRNQGYGKIEVSIADHQVMNIDTTFKNKLR